MTRAEYDRASGRGAFEFSSRELSLSAKTESGRILEEHGVIALVDWYDARKASEAVAARRDWCCRCGLLAELGSLGLCADCFDHLVDSLWNAVAK